MQQKQTVAEMAVEVLARQAGTRATRTGETFEDALKAVLETDAGHQLVQLREGSHRTRVLSGGKRTSRGSVGGSRTRSIIGLSKRSAAESDEKNSTGPSWLLGSRSYRPSGGSWSCVRTANSPSCLAIRCQKSPQRRWSDWPPRTRGRRRKV